jgi:hypothetical protein
MVGIKVVPEHDMWIQKYPTPPYPHPNNKRKQKTQKPGISMKRAAERALW